MECTKVPPVARKVKKKQVKDELDRIKQAEKKRRRLEKALAASAAIRSELEKKKQKKKEEQQRLDEEGAAIAEAVALHVLLGEDTDDPCKIMVEEDEVFSHCSLEGFEWASDARGDVREWNDSGNNGWSFSSGSLNGDLHDSYYGKSWGPTGISAGLIAAQAVSSLRIAEDAHVDSIVFNRMLQS